jgi:asparagine synthase (glutamine-hydrolysing)
MCGIFAIFGNQSDSQHIVAGNGVANGNGHSDDVKKSKNKSSLESLRETAYRCSSKQRHRGPDKTGIVCFDNEKVAMVHERLRIVGVALGDQPLQTDDGNISLVANGEIYNYLKISDELSMFYNKEYVARSDCDVIIGLYEKYGDKLVHHMTGMFAFALFDRKNRKMLAARDPFGILSMYIGEDINGNIWVASEMKCLEEHCSYIQNFPIGE